MRLPKALHLILALFLISGSGLSAEALLSSWYTQGAGKYASLYESDEDQAALNPVSTWERGVGLQDYPSYAGIHELSYTNDWLYLRSTNLPSYIMGPWYQDAARAVDAENFPSNNATIYRLPRNPTDPTTVLTKTLTPSSRLGFAVNGVAVFAGTTASSYSDSNNSDTENGDGAWNQDAYTAGVDTFDAGNGHQESSNHHYHVNPIALRYQLGDSVTYDSSTNTYTEAFDNQHSPIIAWLADGLPVYGPYGYSDPTDATSEVRRMVSGFQLRTDIETSGSLRDSWPDWATALYAGEITFVDGPAVSSSYPLGHYAEDYDYKGDLSGFDLYEGVSIDGAYSDGTDYDLNQYNARYCVTPEFPAGTWAYFATIESDGTPTYPYMIGQAYFGNPTGGAADGAPDSDESGQTLTTVFEGGLELQESITSILVHSPALDQVTLDWEGLEGASYEISETEDLLNSFVAITPEVVAESESPSAIHIPGGSLPQQNFYKITRTEVPYFDDIGYEASEYLTPTLPETGNAVNITVTFPSASAITNTLNSLTYDGDSIDIATANVTRPSSTEISFDVITYGKAPGDYTVSANFTRTSDGASINRNGTHTIHPSILLMIVDDWGRDRSPVDNIWGSGAGENANEVALPNMPNLETLATQGLRFSRAYAQSQCSPTRASILTGRQPFQHGVGQPSQADNFSDASGIDELTIPEVFKQAGAPHELISIGKWHLSGDESGHNTFGGWTRHYGFEGSGVNSYADWTKNLKGFTRNSTVYSTTDQVDHATSFIQTSIAEGKPWFAWVAFNAPHTPLETPPDELAPTGGYTDQSISTAAGDNNPDYTYLLMLEALDTEIGRLLDSIDPAQTEVIIIGDNGTPKPRIQEPYTNSHGKSTLYNGGIHVPLVISGPSVSNPLIGTSSTEIVHCIDLFSTIIEMAGIDESTISNPNTTHSTSIVSILDGTDSATGRFAVSEMQGSINGRAIISDEYPDYKLIIFGDPNNASDTPTYEFYNIANDVDEQSPLGFDAGAANQINTGLLTATELAAYNACFAVDTALGGGYSDNP